MKPTTNRKTRWVALALLVASACAHPERKIAMLDSMRDANQRNVEKLFDTFNHDDLAPLDELVASDYVGPQGDRGPAGFRKIIAGLRAAFPDIHYTIDDVLAHDDKVAIRWHWTGTHKGPFRGFLPTGKTVSNSGTGIFRCQDGKIIAASLETDRLGFLEQIGVVPENVGLGPRPAPAPHP
jgi:steroid delta-isomerase-like uncharacterized protein